MHSRPRGRSTDDEHRDNSRSSPNRRKHRDARHSETYRSRKTHRSQKHDEETRAESSHHGDFSFANYKHEFNKVFAAAPNLVQDTLDFWQFVRKYEAVGKKAGRRSEPPPAETRLNSLGIPSDYDKSHCVNVRLDFDEVTARMPKSADLNDARIRQFGDVLLLYLDFKQKEKFNKLKKLRENQANLPVAKYRDEIVQAVKDERVVVIAGDTGCGKSTQVPQYLWSAGFERIGCTQPRRIACISLAKRVAFETLTENHNEVGYQIRFERQRNQDTKITFITEGLLLRQVSGDSELGQYDVIVLDEVHERHLYGDFLLGIMKCIIHQRSSLKLILMSATINIQLFSDYFANENVRVLQVPGRLYPIELMYRPVLVESTRSKSERFNPSPYIQIMQIIDRKYSADEKGDLLIFLSGMNEITAVADAAKEYAQKKANWIVLALHSTLSIAEQDKVFDYPPDGVRKCIVSTNIAETSITIDGIRFVADSGKVKEMSYDPACKMQRLKEFWISKASAEQRKGRAGRTGPGFCYRIYSEEEYTQLEKYSAPEIQRIPLDSLLLQMMAMGLPDARKFPFIEPPPSESMENSILSLKEHVRNITKDKLSCATVKNKNLCTVTTDMIALQGALTENEKLTCIGKTLSRLPVDIAIGKMLIMGSIFHQVEPVLSVAAALSIQNPFVNRAYKDKECETSRKKIESDHGDPITLLNAYKEWLEVKQQSGHESRGSGTSSRKWCKRRGIEEQRFYEMTKLRTQFKELLQDCNLLRNLSDPSASMSSAERAFRHGELRLLKSLKRTYKQTAHSRKRKELKVERYDIQVENEENSDGEIDIKDVEFRMRNDSSQVQNLLNAATACSYKDLTMLKLILCSGLYPQFAVADEFNYHKSVSEQLFHTRAKPYVALHPMSFFGNNPQVLQLEEPDIFTVPGFKSKIPVSPKYQLLTYISLLETTKPYLVNTLRMPAAQTLLLFSREIDTDVTFSMMVCDSWLALEFPMPDSGQTLLIKATRLRQKWDLLLTKRLQEVAPTDEETEDTTEMEYELSQELVQFMHTTVPYTVKRLLPADLKTMYVGRGANEINVYPNPFQDDFASCPNSIKGGVFLTNNITYNCLIENEWSEKLTLEMSQTPWQCPSCEEEAILSSIQKLQHLNSCRQSNIEKSSSQTVAVSRPVKPNSKPFECTSCGKTLQLTPIEILRHQKQHEKDSLS